MRICCCIVICVSVSYIDIHVCLPTAIISSIPYDGLSTSDATSIITSTNRHESLSTSDVTTMTTGTSHHLITSSYYITYSSPPDGSSGGSSSDNDSGAIYVTVAAVVYFGYSIVLNVITIIIIMVAKKRKCIRQSQQNTTIALTTLAQPPSTPQQAPVCSQQTPKIPNINEDTLASGNPQPAASYPFSYGTEDATVGSISNSSVLPDGAINPPPYSACAGEHTPDGSTDDQVKSLPPDYASTVAS